MMKIIWDKKIFEQNILSGEGEKYIMDFWMPVQIYINGVDVTGLENKPEGEISLFFDIFLNLFFIFKIIDPNKLKDKEFNFDSNEENCVSGGGFRFYISSIKDQDIIEIKYHNFTFPIGEFHSNQILLKDFAKGLLVSTKELLDELISIDPVHEDDEEYIILEENMETLLKWYKDRYHEDALLG